VAQIRSFLKKVKKYAEFHNATMKISIPFLTKTISDTTKARKVKTGSVMFIILLLRMEESASINKQILINSIKKA